MKKEKFTIIETLKSKTKILEFGFQALQTHTDRTQQRKPTHFESELGAKKCGETG